jgi:hypothetical protein
MDNRRLIIVILLGTVAFVSTGFLPSPFDKMLIVFQALTFALGSLITSKGGATYVSLINGALLTVQRIEFFPLSIVFSLLYGVMIDFSFYAFKVRAKNNVSGTRLIAALTIVTAITGLASTFVTTLMGLMPMIPVLYFAILAIGVLNGVVAGYLALIIWKRFLIQLQSSG